MLSAARHRCWLTPVTDGEAHGTAKEPSFSLPLALDLFLRYPRRAVIRWRSHDLRPGNRLTNFRSSCPTAGTSSTLYKVALTRVYTRVHSMVMSQSGSRMRMRAQSFHLPVSCSFT